MPKKTKKEKIIAEYHRKLKLLQNQPQTTHQTQTTAIPQKEKEQPKRIIEQDLTNNKFFLVDLKKSVFLTVAIIALEILFYFATIKNYLKLM